MILLLALITVGIVLAVKWYGGSSPGVRISGRAEEPVDILKNRYARGEIARDEFKRMKQDLRGI